jgi:hypothetical protein
MAAASLMVAACGNHGSSAAPPADAGEDTTETDGSSQDSLATAYPAFTVDAPQVAKNQGTILTSPVIVTVTWPGDTNASTWEGFGDAIGASAYWSATTSEYGVGPATSGASNHVRMTQPLPSLSYYDVETFVLSTLQGVQPDAGVFDAGSGDGGAPNPPWPAPTYDSSGNSQTIYSLFIPASSAVTDPGSGMSFCAEGGYGYHDQVVLGGKPIAFAVTLECTSQTLPDLEETAAHETVESATNPYPSSTTLGYIDFDAAHVSWNLYTGFSQELADVCQNWADSYYQDTGDFPYWVQSTWSNTAALAGHDPCVPHPAGAYHGMTLLASQETSVSVNLQNIGMGLVKSQGFKATLGQPLSFQVGFFSDAPTSGPWTITYDFPKDMAIVDASFNPIGNGTATVAIDKTSGQNGDLANVTVTVKTKGPSGFHVMAITWDPPHSGSPYGPHYLPVLIVDE